MKFIPKSNTDIGKRLEDLRKERKLTQEELAKLIGPNRNRISQWENGERELKASHLALLANALGTTSDYLIGLTDNATNDITKKSACDYLCISEKTLDGLKANLEKIYTSYHPNTQEALELFFNENFKILFKFIENLIAVHEQQNILKNMKKPEEKTAISAAYGYHHHEDLLDKAQMQLYKVILKDFDEITDKMTYHFD